MKTEGQIKHKLSQVRFRHLKREVRNGLSVKSENCSFNGLVSLPVYGEIGVCLHGAGSSSWNGGLCDSSTDNRAESCSLYHCSNTKDQLKSDFNMFLKSSDRAHIAERYPDMAALLWVLDTEAETAIESAEPTEEPEEPVSSQETRTTSDSLIPIRESPSYLHILWAWLLGFFRRG